MLQSPWEQFGSELVSSGFALFRFKDDQQMPASHVATGLYHPAAIFVWVPDVYPMTKAIKLFMLLKV